MSKTRPYLTKFAFGRWWFYRDTRRKWKFRYHTILGWPLIVVSYRKREEIPALTSPSDSEGEPRSG